ncbi:MAG: HD domain-containing protein [bacterium]
MNTIQQPALQIAHKDLFSVDESGIATVPVTLKLIRRNPQIEILMDKANTYLGVIGYTEHGRRHGKVVSDTARFILRKLGDPDRQHELAAIAGYLHDIGNVINRDYHAQTGAVLASQILTKLDMPFEEIIEVIAAIGNHHEEDGLPVSRLTAALIIADKADVHRSRVRNTRSLRTDIHDRVNYSVTQSRIEISEDAKKITLELTVDTKLSSVMEYFEIFLSRMLISKKAAKFLHTEFNLHINGTYLL